MLSTPQRLWQVLKSNLQREESLLTETADIAVPDDRGLFVIGAARSGTTVFQNALNSSPEIFLLGEPALQDDPGTPDFAARYNTMHRSWGNQENKSSFCPPLFDQDAPWHHYLARLARHYRYVGSKIVVNPHEAARTCQQLFEFHCRYFYRSHYVFTFRNPIDVLMSTRGLAELNGDEAAGYDTVLKSFLQVMALYIRFLRNLPSVRAVFHEDLGEAVLRDTGAWLGVDLGEAAGYYDNARVRRYSLDQVPEHARALAEEVIAAYEELRGQVAGGMRLVQLEQNSNHIDPAHFTPLGNLHRRIEGLLAAS